APIDGLLLRLSRLFALASHLHGDSLNIHPRGRLLASVLQRRPVDLAQKSISRSRDSCRRWHVSVPGVFTNHHSAICDTARSAGEVLINRHPACLNGASRLKAHRRS
ncbi:uncharacterized protein B0H18DRAFT_1038788, partial [Fomitopsis serialis]|uniref:uncharacterized protein n=1 Tax=Fomitopsis serialis TaxID=139415 RepID=UPI002007C2B0